MTLHQLKIFAAVARHLSITKASEELGMSQPAVSHQLKLLEEEFEKSFYFSSNIGVQLTREGQIFLSKTAPILAKVGEVETSFKPKQQQHKPDSLIVGGNHTLSVTLLLVVRSGGTTVKELLRRGFKLNIAAQCEVSEAVKAAVKRGLGVGLLNRDSIGAIL